MKDSLAAASLGAFGEDGSLVYSETTQQVLWGQAVNEQGYWTNQTDQSGSRTCQDPYGYIDGGETPGGSYQFCCNSATWKGTALALLLMPELRCLWDNQHFLDYVDRWVTAGAITQPDPCAPTDGNLANYGVTYGPDGNGGCILDTEPTCTAQELADGATAPCTGRWPALHGSSVDDGYYNSAFHASMWTAYRSTVPTDPPDCDGSGQGGAGGTAGAGGSAGGSGGSTSTGSSGSGGGAGGALMDDDSGCGCRLHGHDGTDTRGGAAAWLWVLLLGLASARRR
jgi:hypothetical protein